MKKDDANIVFFTRDFVLFKKVCNAKRNIMEILLSSA